MKDLVSIITPTYNSQRFIESTIKSVQKQTYQYWEMIIIDDGSTDGSINIIRSFVENDDRIKLIILHSNNGPAIARNKGIQLACGRYIAFLDSDDLWYPNKLKKQIEFMNNNNYYFTFTSFTRINEDGELLTDKLIYAPKVVTYYDLLKTDYIGCLTAMYDLSKLGKVYMPDIIKGQDYCCWLKILKTGINAYFLNEQYASYRVRRNSISSNKIIAVHHQWKIYRKIEKLSFYSSISYLFWYIYFGIWKRAI